MLLIPCISQFFTGVGKQVISGVKIINSIKFSIVKPKNDFIFQTLLFKPQHYIVVVTVFKNRYKPESVYLFNSHCSYCTHIFQGSLCADVQDENPSKIPLPFLILLLVLLRDPLYRQEGHCHFATQAPPVLHLAISLCSISLPLFSVSNGNITFLYPILSMSRFIKNQLI